MGKKAQITEQSIQEFGRSLRDDDTSAETQRRYLNVLRSLYEWLPEDKLLGEEELIEFIENLMTQYSRGTVNTYVSYINGFLRFLGCYELCLTRLSKIPAASPELTREE